MVTIIEEEEIDLVPTSEFKLGKYPFETFNYLQSLCYPHCFTNSNLIVSASTSAGKTIVGELVISNMIEQGKKAIFLCPLKALSDEKYSSWTNEEHFFSKHKIEIITGDYRLTEQKVKALQEANIIVMTSEMLDTRTRYLGNTDNHWLLDVGVVVVDESHLLHTSRGPALEVGLMRFTENNQQARIVFLSATMSNYQTIGDWVESLNQKDTRVISTNWRPVNLYKKYLRSPHHDFSAKRIDSVTRILAPLICDHSMLGVLLIDPDPVIREVAKIRGKAIYEGDCKSEDKKTLVFVHSKEEGRKLCKKLDDNGIVSYFHNADLVQKDRKKLEEAFRKKDLNVLIATSTLAYGLNMPAKNVIIAGNKRGIEKVEDMDIAQMAGRAGRFGMYDRGDVFLVCDNDYKLPDDFQINSRLSEVRILAFHLVAEIYSRRIKTQRDAENWYKRTLAYKQGFKDICAQTLSKLLLCEAVELDLNTGELVVTPLGRVARDMYMNPIDVYIWRENFKQVKDWNSNSQMAWALTNDTLQFRMDYTPKEIKKLALVYKMSLRVAASPDNLPFGAVFFYRQERADKNYPEQTVAQIDMEIMSMWSNMARDLKRVFSTIRRINDLEDWKKDVELQTLQARIVYGVGPHLLELVSLPGIGETIANQLYANKIDSLQKLRENLDVLHTIIERKASVTRIKNALQEHDLALLECSPIDFLT